jgi:hypothetical protein
MIVLSLSWLAENIIYDPYNRLLPQSVSPPKKCFLEKQR